MREVHYKEYSQTDEYCKSDTRYIGHLACESECEVSPVYQEHVRSCQDDHYDGIVPEERPVKSMSILSDPSVAKIPHTDPGGSHSRRCCCRATWESEISILVPEYRYDTEDDIDEECPGEYSDTLAYMSESSEYLEVHLYQGVQYEERCDIVECHTRGEILISEQQSREMWPRHDKKSSNPQHQHTQITREYPEYGPDLLVISSAPDL